MVTNDLVSKERVHGKKNGSHFYVIVKKVEKLDGTTLKLSQEITEDGYVVVSSKKIEKMFNTVY